MTKLNLSARACHRTQSVKLARTIADLAGSDNIQSVHLADAQHYVMGQELMFFSLTGERAAWPRFTKPSWPNLILWVRSNHEPS